jgi:hypothetical protein
MSVTGLQDFYRAAYYRCRLENEGVPPVRAIQELVHAWKAMRDWLVVLSCEWLNIHTRAACLYACYGCWRYRIGCGKYRMWVALLEASERGLEGSGVEPNSHSIPSRRGQFLRTRTGELP